MDSEKQLTSTISKNLSIAIGLIIIVPFTFFIDIDQMANFKGLTLVLSGLHITLHILMLCGTVKKWVCCTFRC